MLRITMMAIANLLLLASCNKMYSNRDLTSFSKSDFNYTRNIKTKTALLPDSLILPTKCEIINNYFVVIDQKGDKHIHLFDLKSNKYINAFVSTGSGPGEI